MRELILPETGEDAVKAFKALVVALGVALWLPVAGQAAEGSAPSAKNQMPPAAPPTTSGECLRSVMKLYEFCTNSRAAPTADTRTSEKWLKAVVSLYNFCTNPHDVAVELPPPPASFQPPCKSRDPWTVHDRGSGCGE